MTEKPAKGVRGFLLYNFFTDRHFFRIYNPDNKKEFTDYDIAIEDLEVEIIAGGAAFFESEEGNRIGWSSEVGTNVESRLEEFTFEGGPRDGEKVKYSNVRGGLQVVIKDKRYTYKRDGLILRLEKEENRT